MSIKIAIYHLNSEGCTGESEKQHVLDYAGQYSVREFAEKGLEVYDSKKCDTPFH